MKEVSRFPLSSALAGRGLERQSYRRRQQEGQANGNGAPSGDQLRAGLMELTDRWRLPNVIDAVRSLAETSPTWALSGISPSRTRCGSVSA